jgi:hypothetical protein
MSSTPDLVVPDLFEAIVGRRCWGLGETNGVIVLVSGHGRTIWPPREALEAECAREGHAPPVEGCTCGIYALAEDWPYYDYSGPGYAVFGEVYLWGEVVCGERGYRAARAYPRALYLAHRDGKFLKRLRDAYGVPVRLRDPYAKPGGGPSGHRA